MCIDTLDVIDFLIFKSQNCIRFTEYQSREIRETIDKCKYTLSNSTLYKETEYFLEQENAK